MYGYVIPDKLNMYVKDFYEYKAYYCGICKSTGKHCGQLMRFSTNYDSVFLNAFVHNMLKVPFSFSNETCVLHPLKKRTIAVDDAITTKIIQLNNLLLYKKIQDDILDGGHGLSRTASTLLKKHYKRARKTYPLANESIIREYDRLRKYELEKCNSIDKVSDPFAMILVSLGREFKELSEDEYTVLYQLGKWVYLIDAIDDIDSDYKSGNYNVFLNYYNDYAGDKKQFIDSHYQEIKNIFDMIINAMRVSYNRLDITIAEGILTNTIYMGISNRTNDILRSDKCKKIRF